MNTYTCINVNDALNLIQEGATVADIRDGGSYASSHITNAVNLNNDNVQAFIETTAKDTPVVVCCYHGNSSKGAAEFLAEQGFSQVYSLNGGFSQWSAMYPDHCEIG
ncbi:thiosulfate sulfurtransferase GlpE [Maribrevibacterium harenarium]|uniref:Thiosulfate sulfurtransferase GlpE n=1 Tax=Maribrevibacterium harenarium TaxID=2589817 RepID=A0A501X3A0_9GAMM|nr:thiosulfate sulfurtransferase GlpE [Maribrevibacterium harenarium]TPE54959.1 thiosulfate sulfurtransferase GlpE [Maribrevibacterium harenarium]